jgi:hypothetical protein
LPPSGLAFNQRVKIVAKDQIGIIHQICWHFTEARPFFHLLVNGKRAKRRFWRSELLPVDT